MDTGRCPRCGHPSRAPHEFVSRHRTVDGPAEYVRCRCGRLQVRRGDAVILRGRT